jgi:DNA-3-methyladenine glycosylase
MKVIYWTPFNERFWAEAAKQPVQFPDDFIGQVDRREKPHVCFQSNCQNSPKITYPLAFAALVCAILLAYLQRPSKLTTQFEKSPRQVQDPWSLKPLLKASQLLRLPFYDRPTIKVARDLIGCILIHHVTAGMIVEVEAYLGLGDLAAHAARGITDRTRVIFGPPGRAYVYFIYGMHECLNVVAEQEGTAGCVLIRALEPLTGVATMYERRCWNGSVKGLANGPGKLTEALAISRAQYGLRLDRNPLQIRRWKSSPQFTIEATPRIGIRHCADWPLRFVWKDHPCVSH